MNIKLLELKLANFKGCQKELTVPFWDRTMISGQNATGKTTVFDAFTWLMFNHDSHGNTKFDVRPKNADGSLVDDVEISVEARLRVDEDEYALKKIQKQIWRKKRGTNEKKFEGNINEFSINGYPKTEAEFKAFISGIIDEKIFVLVTDPAAFTALPWKEQRETLMKFVGIMSDAEIALTYGDEYKLLIPELKIASTDDILKKYTKTKNALNKQLDEIPARIDELSRQLSTVNVEELEIQKAAKQVAVKKIDDELSGGVGNLEEINAKREEVLKLKFQQSEILNRENKRLDDGRQAAREDYMKKQSEHNAVCDNLDAALREISELAQKKQSAEKLKQVLKEKYEELKSSVFPAYQPLEPLILPKALTDKDMICPTCGQELPEEVRLKRIADHKKRCEKAKASYEESCKRHKDQYEHDKTQFEENRKKDMESVISGGREKKAEIESLQKRMDELNTKAESLKEERKTSEKNVEKAKSAYASIPSQADVTGLDDYKEITDKIQILEREIEELSKPSAEQEELKAKKADLQNEISDIEAQIKAADNSQIKNRIAELEEEKSRVAQKVAEQEQMIDLTESFIRAKMQMISQKINEKFEVVSWNLFENQINGGLKETCECTVNGVPYSSLNDGHKIIAGLDIIKSMSRLHNVSAPIFIDNAESINEYNIPDTGAQMIFLRVTDDKSLVIEGVNV